MVGEKFAASLWVLAKCQQLLGVFVGTVTTHHAKCDILLRRDRIRKSVFDLSRLVHIYEVHI